MVASIIFLAFLDNDEAEADDARLTAPEPVDSNNLFSRCQAKRKTIFTTVSRIVG